MCCDNGNDCNAKGIPENATTERYEPPKEVEEPVASTDKTDTVENSGQPSNKINTTTKTTTTTQNSKAPEKSATQEPAIKEKKQVPKIVDQTASNQKS